MRNYRKYTPEQIIEAAKQSSSVAGFLRNLGLKDAGGNYKTAYQILQKHQVDTKHWSGSSWNKDKQLKDWSNYTKGSTLKPHLIKQRGHKCESCHNHTWKNQLIPLEVHHIDGNASNNTITNLQLVCCNCHALTNNYRGKKLKGTGVTKNGKYPRKREELCQSSIEFIDKKCLNCQSDFIVPKNNLSLNQRKYCTSSCCNKHKAKTKKKHTKINWPSNEELLERLKTLSCVRLAKELGVSDNAIRKRLRR